MYLVEKTFVSWVRLTHETPVKNKHTAAYKESPIPPNAKVMFINSNFSRYPESSLLYHIHLKTLASPKKRMKTMLFAGSSLEDALL